MQQKALKERDRQNKTESAAMLHNYRGKDEMVKSQLASIKDQDRKGKQEAERLLHGYRAKDLPAGQKKSPTRAAAAAGVMPEQVEREEIFNSETVANLAANFDNKGKPVEAATARGQVATPAPGVEPSSPEGSSSDSGIMVETPPKPEEGTEGVSSKAMMNTSGEWISVETSDAPMEEVAKISERSTILESLPSATDGPSKELEETVPPLVVEPPVAPPATSADQAVPAPSTTRELTEKVAPEPTRMDVDFSFGLLTCDYVPNLDKYMAAAAEIVGSRFADSPVAFHSNYAPMVKDVQGDPLFVPPPGVAAKKCIVQASVPLFSSSNVDPAGVCSSVRSVLRSAIENGSFLAIAQRQ